MNKKFLRQRWQRKWKYRKPESMASKQKADNIRKPTKICSKCKKRRISKYHHWLCDVCYREKLNRIKFNSFAKYP